VTGWVLPRELDQPLPRRVELNGVMKGAGTVLTIVWLGLFGFLAMSVYASAHKAEILRSRGVATEAQVTSLHIEKSRNSQAFYVDYQFSPASPTMRQDVRHAVDPTDEADYRALRIGQSVPILYDPTNLGLSDLNFRDRIHREDPFRTFYGLTAAFGVFMGVSYAICFLVFLKFYSSERRLLRYGRAAAATIVTQRQSGIGRRPATVVTYQFTDADGKVIEDTRKNLPGTAQLKQPGFKQYLAGILDNPTVLYDPDHSEKNMLYPPVWAVCRLTESKFE